MKQQRLRRMLTVVSICAVAGAIAGIAGSAAAPSDPSTSREKAAAQREGAQNRAARRDALRMRVHGAPGFGVRFGPPVHSEVVTPNEDGDGFITVTMDHGKLLSVDGTTLHLEQGTDDATYKEDAAIDVGSDAKVVRNGDEAELGELKKDDRVHVIRSPEGNVVMAASEDWKPRFHRHRHRFGPGSPPPGEHAMP